MVVKFACFILNYMKLILTVVSIITWTQLCSGQLILVPKAINPVIIDGVIEDEEWADAISDTSISNLILGTSDGLSDISGNVSLKWDEQNLYVLFQITDDAQFVDTTDGDPAQLNTFDDDSVEVFLDINNTNSGDLNQNAGRYQYRFIPLQDGEIERFPDSLPVTGFQFSHQGTTSYIMEISMPWSTLGVIDPGVDDILGFEIGLNDDDDGDDREAQLFWNAQDSSAWQDASQWGDIQLKEEKIEPPVINPSTPTLPLVRLYELDRIIWMEWEEIDDQIYQLRRSTDLVNWQDDDRPLSNTGNTRYFSVSEAEVEVGTFFDIRVTSTE